MSSTGVGGPNGETADEAAGDNNTIDDDQVDESGTTTEDGEAVSEAQPSETAQTVTCNECSTQQSVDFGEHTDAAKQWQCSRCGAVNTARFPGNSDSGIETGIQDANREEAVASQEDQARGALGDEAVDKIKQDVADRREAAADTNAEAVGVEEEVGDGAADEESGTV